MPTQGIRPKFEHLNNKCFLIQRILTWAYNDAVNNEKYGHLVLDLKPYTDNSMRVLAKIFDPYPIVYVPRNL